MYGRGNSVYEYTTHDTTDPQQSDSIDYRFSYFHWVQVWSVNWIQQFPLICTAVNIHHYPMICQVRSNILQPSYACTLRILAN